MNEKPVSRHPNARMGNQNSFGHGAPPGNQNARRAKLVRRALKEAFIELDGGAGDEDLKLQRRLRKYARGLIALAEAGDVAAYKEINDRIEGKAVQPVSGDEDGPPIQVSEIVIRAVNAASDRSASKSDADTRPATD